MAELANPVPQTWTKWQSGGMPVTLRRLLADPALGLRVLAGEPGLDRAVGWVHVSELDDPTPFLEGGELLLTTGLRLVSDAAYVARLTERRLAGLGFGIGLSHAGVPRELVRAAAAAGMPLLEVPRRTPFIAISKAVSAALAADSYAEVTATNAAQQELTRAALRGPDAAVRRLARLLDGFVLLIDRRGTVVRSAPAAAATRLASVTAELARLRGGPASASFEVDGQHVVVQVLRHHGFLVAGRPEPFDRTSRHVLSAAASLLTLALARVRGVEDAQRRLRTALMRLLLAGQRALVAEIVELPPEPVEVFALTGPAERALDALDGGPAFCAELDGFVVAIAPEGYRMAGLTGGVAAARGYADLAAAHRHAVSVAANGELVRFRGDLVSLLPAEDAQAFAATVLEPVERHDAAGRGDLLVSLAEWLRSHGQWDPAATRLGVHRHTLRNRMAKVAELTGRDLDDPDVRTELWMALRLRGLVPGGA
ncbi:PucR family transcriptional regulator [Amycolatopsis granulosa]|uniref:PucR family transcriptional regulator n=1 Tax=Amycolatopsis granulosa TaxID=185684 RepID=UPI001FBC0B4C|nr:PucR family transcriptional regulator [Amycolatopsis granulosa]NIH87040.1 purine catabolism regulator [Amycolatopsis granulosa]